MMGIATSCIASDSLFCAAINSHTSIVGGDVLGASDSSDFVMDDRIAPSFFLDGSLQVGVSRFARNADGVLSCSPLSDDDNTSAGNVGAPPPGGSDSDDGSGGGGGSKPLGNKVKAVDVLDALLSIPLRHNVILDEGLATLMVQRGWIEFVSDEKRAVMKEAANGLEVLERELSKVEGKLSRMESSQRRLRAQVEDVVHSLDSFITAVTSSVRRTQGPLEKMRAEIAKLKEEKGEIEGEIMRVNIAREWLDRIAWSAYGYVSLTDAGHEVLTKLSVFKGDEKMEYMGFDDYILHIDSGGFSPNI